MSGHEITGPVKKLTLPQVEIVGKLRAAWRGGGGKGLGQIEDRHLRQRKSRRLERLDEAIRNTDGDAVIDPGALVSTCSDGDVVELELSRPRSAQMGAILRFRLGRGLKG